MKPKPAKIAVVKRYLRGREMERDSSMSGALREFYFSIPKLFFFEKPLKNNF